MKNNILYEKVSIGLICGVISCLTACPTISIQLCAGKKRECYPESWTIQPTSKSSLGMLGACHHSFQGCLLRFQYIWGIVEMLGIPSSWPLCDKQIEWLAPVTGDMEYAFRSV
jgi:hypothetical protein